MTRTKIGLIATDTASLLLIDPCRALSQPGRTRTPSYNELMKLKFPPEQKAITEARSAALAKLGREPLTHAEHSVLLSPSLRYEPIVPFHGGLAISIDADGRYDVYAEYDAHGMARIVIELNGEDGL